jgi:D-alanine-D-alanine ligase
MTLSGSSKKRRIGVLMGGLSSEREVSLETGRGVLAALRERGHDAVPIDWKEGGPTLSALVYGARPDVVWNALHGTYGEDGAVQGFLTCAHIPCTGSGILASSLAMDKVMSKRIFESNDIPTPPWMVIPAADDHANLPEGWDAPVVIKPAQEGSSVGVTVCLEAGEVGPALERARSYHGPTLIERYIPGAEIHIGVLDDEVLGSIEVRPAKGFYDYDAKYCRDDTEYLIPTTLAPELIARAEATALRAHQALGCSGHSRVDLRIDDAGQPFVLEVNTLPGMTSHSLLPKIAAHRGIRYADLCERILASARTG